MRIRDLRHEDGIVTVGRGCIPRTGAFQRSSDVDLVGALHGDCHKVQSIIAQYGLNPFQVSGGCVPRNEAMGARGTRNGLTSIKGHGIHEPTCHQDVTIVAHGEVVAQLAVRIIPLCCVYPCALSILQVQCG